LKAARDPPISAGMHSTGPHRDRRSTFWLALALVWFGVVAAGLAGMAAYSNRPGQPAQAPERWPEASGLTRDLSRPTIVVLAHPHCDCTRASLVELARLMARAPGRARAVVVFMMPVGVGDDWATTSLWRLASSIPGAEVVRDDDGQEARRFGAATSGQTLMYDASGRLVFSGGITSSRGHEGDNAGVAAMLARLGGQPHTETSSPVFGCSIFGEASPRMKATAPDASQRVEGS
jgi:hypothetical protein